MTSFGLYDLNSIGAAGIHKTSTSPATLQPLLDRFCLVFDNGLRGCTGLPIHPKLLEGATPKFFEARPVPFTLHSSVEDELN